MKTIKHRPPRAEKQTWGKKWVINPFIYGFYGLVVALSFLVGLVDRVILVFMFWIEIESLTKRNFYVHHVDNSFLRVLTAAGLFCIYYFLIR